MSFYGNVFYEFEQVFFKFKFQNSEDEKVDLEPSNSGDGTLATERWDTFYMNAGNRWIGMQANETGEKGVTLFHTGPGDETTPLETLVTTGSDNKLSAGQTIQVPTIEVDNAGHIASSSLNNYTLPEASEIIDEGMVKRFEDGTEIASISQSDNKNAEIELTPGSVIEVSNLVVNSKGVIQENKPIYIKMPADKMDQNFDEIYSRLDVAEEDIDALELYNTVNNFAEVKQQADENAEDIVELTKIVADNKTELEEKISDGDSNLQDEVNYIKDNYASLDLTGDTAPDGFNTIKEALGDLQVSANAMSSAAGIPVTPTVSGQFQALVTYAGLMYWQLSIANSKIKELEDRVDTLEKK